MILFHGSDREIAKADIVHSRKEVDFGTGFITPIEEQARNWCKKFVSRGKQGIVSVYMVDDAAYENCRTKRFAVYSEKRLDFVSQ